MEELGRIHQLIVPFFGHNLTFNLEVIIMTWIVISILLLIGFLASSKRGVIPNRFQVVVN
jgi:F-type H+-transporting ATPase subunit a